MAELNKKQKLAIARVNRALKALEDADIKIAGMDCDLLYATKQAIEECENYADYSDVARAVQMSDEGTGHLYSGVYEDSGGW